MVFPACRAAYHTGPNNFQDFPVLTSAITNKGGVTIIAGRSPLPASGAYDASKFAVEAITDVLRMELHPFGIAVSLIEAGAVATPIWDKSVGELDELSRQVEAERFAPYRAMMAAVHKEASESARHALPVSAVVRAVEHAMTARRPKTRYVLGKDAWLWLALNLLPDRWRDKLVLSHIKR
jgi:short-subunit dehydrogenase